MHTPPHNRTALPLRRSAAVSERCALCSHADAKRLKSDSHTWLRKPETVEVAVKQRRFIEHLVRHVNSMAGYDEQSAGHNDAVAVWGVQEHTIASTFVADLAVQQLLPCVPLGSTAFKSNTCAPTLRPALCCYCAYSVTSSVLSASSRRWAPVGGEARVSEMVAAAHTRAGESGDAVKAVLAYARQGGCSNPEAVADPKMLETMRADFRWHVRHMILAYMLSLVVCTAVRPSQTLGAMLVAIFGAPTDDKSIAEGDVPTGMHFGRVFGAGGDIILNWPAAVRHIRAKDQRTRDGRAWDPLGVVATSTHGAHKNNARVTDGANSNRVQKHTTVKHVVSEDWGLAMSLGNQALYIAYLVQLYNTAFDTASYTKGAHPAAGVMVLPMVAAACHRARQLRVARGPCRVPPPRAQDDQGRGAHGGHAGPGAHAQLAQRGQGGLLEQARRQERGPCGRSRERGGAQACAPPSLVLTSVHTSMALTQSRRLYTRRGHGLRRMQTPTRSTTGSTTS